MSKNKIKINELKKINIKKKTLSNPLLWCQNL